MGLDVAARVGKGDWTAAVGGDSPGAEEGERVGKALNSKGVEAETGCVLLGLP